MARYLLTIEYDGTAYEGWQYQEGKPTIEGAIEDAIEHIIHERVTIYGSGRTDSGVHALRQKAHFDSERELDVQRLARAINYYLPLDIAIVRAERVADDFHARYNVRCKTYLYKIYNGAERSPLRCGRYMETHYTLDIGAMRSALDMLKGVHDFKGFATAGSSVKTTVREIYRADILTQGEEIYIYVGGSGFLYNMVRTIVGTLIDVGRGKRTLDEMKTLIDTGDIRLKGAVAPASGLYLYDVEY